MSTLGAEVQPSEGSRERERERDRLLFGTGQPLFGSINHGPGSQLGGPGVLVLPGFEASDADLEAARFTTTTTTRYEDVM